MVKVVHVHTDAGRNKATVLPLAGGDSLKAYQYARDGCSFSTLVGRVGSFFKSARVFSSLEEKKNNKTDQIIS